MLENEATTSVPNTEVPAQPAYDGVITGGWEYVQGAWGIGVVVLVAYIATLIIRHRQEVAS